MFKTEKELGDVFLAIIKKLGYEYWCEVETIAGIIDVVAYKDDTFYTFHLKKNFSNKVLEQASKCNIFNTENYIVIPVSKKTKKDKVQQYFIENFNIGVIEVNNNNIKYIEECQNISYYNFLSYRNTIACKNRDKKEKKDISTYLYESQKNDLCGVKGGGYDTAFKRSLRLLKEYYTENEYISLNKTWEDLKNELHWKSKYSFKNAISTLYYLDIVKEARKVMMDKKI